MARVRKPEAALLAYGDPWRSIDLRLWRERATAPLRSGPWIVGHADLAARLIEAGQILQALQDMSFHDTGRDRDDPRWRPLRLYLLTLARRLAISFAGGPQPCPPPPVLPGDLPERLPAREPEGYAFYAVYPEAYAMAARRTQLGPDALVIGLRSIGASLAPMVAAELGAPDFVTLRPGGEPFDRTINAPDLAQALTVRPPRDVVIVDEGPGLSGSSFAGVARFVRANSPHSRLHFMPSHAGDPGAQASAAARALFATVPRHVASFDDALPALASDWVADLTGAALEPPEDISGGAWRRHACLDETQWPAIDPAQERRKFLLRAERGCFLLKFIGLGDIGLRKAQLASALSDARLAPEALGYRHGFLIERWRGDARPLDPRRDRPLIVPALARYLAFRQRRFACADAFGAAPEDLRRMVVRNASLALGEEAGRIAGALMAPLAQNAAMLRKTATDNRIHAHEWLVAPDGAVLKTDGVDHHAGHDLIGAQDIVYDVAAASIEFELTSSETDELCNGVENDSGQSVARALLAPMRIAWLSYELGRISLAESGCGAGDERQRLHARRLTLTGKLHRELCAPGGSTNRELQSHTLVWPT